MWELVNKPSPSNDTLLTMARAQDRATGMLAPRTTFCNLDYPVNTISTNKDFTQVVAAGRNVFMILTIDEHGLTEKMNLRVGKINLNFSITDVMWHPLDDSIIATAAGNGAVVLWNLNKVSHTKQEHVFNDHKRTVNKICFHPTDANTLLCGSQDGTMTTFDIRKQCVAAKFFGRSDSIRDVQFSPFEKNLFAAACESGNIQLWDLRKPDQFLVQFTGHSGPVFSIDWHPEDRSWLGTGGRDKTIKVWNVHSKGISIHSVSTIAEVACVRWRPREKYHIASSSLVVDHLVSVWDVRRPYIPFAAFTEHQDVVTDIIWHNESDLLLSCSKDSTIYQHVFQDALRPADHAPPVGLGVSSRGDVCNAFSAKPELTDNKKNSFNKPLSQQAPAMPAFFKKTPIADYEFKCVQSTLSLYNCEEMLNEISIESLAKKLIFSGKPFPEICIHNSKVCQNLGLYQKAQSWLILKYLFSEISVGDFTSSSTHPSSSDNVNRGSALDSVAEGIGDDDLDSTDSLDNDDVYPGINKVDEIDLSVGGADLDAIFQDEQFDGQLFSSEAINDDMQDWTLPNEAFQPRHSIGEQSLSVEQVPSHDPPLSPVLHDNTNYFNYPEKQKTGNADISGLTLRNSKYLFLPEWESKPLVVEMLKHFAERGDVQMTVTALLALQDKIGDEIDMATKEEWFLAYLELLSRFELWTIANRIIKLSNVPNVAELNHNSTTIKTLCGGCNKPIASSCHWYCNKCKKNAAPCSVCHLPVKGLYVWCQGCGHGGHLAHIKEWVEKNRQCPAGCGHRCEYS